MSLTGCACAVCGNHGIDGIVAPSVLASNFADLGNEVKRMMDNGAQWVHMGKLRIDTKIRAEL